MSSKEVELLMVPQDPSLNNSFNQTHLTIRPMMTSNIRHSKPQSRLWNLRGKKELNWISFSRIWETHASHSINSTHYLSHVISITKIRIVNPLSLRKRRSIEALSVERTKRGKVWTMKRSTCQWKRWLQTQVQVTKAWPVDSIWLITQSILCWKSSTPMISTCKSMTQSRVLIVPMTRRTLKS